MQLDNFKVRRAELMQGGNKIGIYFCNLTSSQPMFITLDTEMVNNTYKEETAVTATPVVTLADQEYMDTFGKDRFIFMSRIKSYLNGSSLDIYYDRKHEDIIFTPIPDYASIQPKNLTFDCYGFRVGTGIKVDTNMTVKLLFPVDENPERGRCKLPEAKKLEGAKVRLASYPGMQHAGMTQDANTFEEMLDQAVNLKRSQRNMYNFLEMGTVTEVFAKNEAPIYLLQQVGPRLFDYKYLGLQETGNCKIYVPLPF